MNKTKDKSRFNLIKYFKEVKSEYKQVIFPTRKKLVKTLKTVIGLVVFSTIFIYGIDTLFTQLISIILNLK